MTRFEMALDELQLAWSVAGLLLGWWALNNSMSDVAWLHQNKVNGIRRFMAVGRTRNELGRMMIQFVFTAVGFFTVMMRDPANAMSLVATIRSVGFMLGTAILTTLSIFDHIDRQTLETYDDDSPGA